MVFFKRTLPVFFATLFGLTFVVQFFVPAEVSQTLLLRYSRYTIIVSGIALFLGLYSLVHAHVTKIRRMVSGWGYSVVTIVALVITALLGFSAILEPAGWKYGGIAPGSSVYWIYDNMLRPMQSTMFSILAFFIASAAFRAFRARSWEATVLLLSAVLIMMGQVPLGYKLWSELPAVSEWLLSYPNLAARRALLFGITLGVLATSLRIIFGIERTYLGGKE